MKKILFSMLALVAIATTARAQVTITDPKTLSVTFTKAMTLLTELSAQDKIVLSAVTTLAEQGKPDGYSVVVDSRKGITTLKRGTKALFGVDAKNGSIKVPTGVTSADNINVTLTSDLRQALTARLASQLAGYDAIQIKFAIGTPTGIEINSTNFPDANFRSYVSGATIDTDKNGYLSDTEIAKVTEIHLSGKNIANLKGIEHFTALLQLDCADNKLTSLDVSKNTKLFMLFCHLNQIKGDKMQALVESLPKVSSGTFIVIDTERSNEGNVITKPQVAIANGKKWKVKALNGSDYTGSDDTPTGIAIAINATNFPDANFRNFVSGATIDKDKNGYLSGAEIAAVKEILVIEKNIANLQGIEHFTALESLYCYYNQLTSLDVSKNTALKKLSCNSNDLTSLDVSKNTALEWLNCDHNDLTSLDVSENAALTRLDCDHNQLTSLDVSNNAALEWLYCYNNDLTSLDVSKNAALTRLYCNFNQLTSLDVSKNAMLTELHCYNNQIKGDKMLALVNSLPKVSSGSFQVINTKSKNEKNVITKSQVAIAKGKNWKVYDYNGGSVVEYAGSDDTTTGLTAVESGQLTVDSWYSIDGKKLQGEPTKKGVYIIKGKKVKK